MNPSETIDNYISSLPAWQGKNIALFRQLIRAAMPDITENWKWDVPVWSGKKMIAAASGFTEHTKFNFFNGATLADPHRLFNSGLDSKKHRSINLAEGESVDEQALKELITAAIALDTGW